MLRLAIPAGASVPALLLLVALVAAGCGFTGIVETTAIPIPADAQAFTRIAAGVVPAGAWSYAVKIAPGGSWCDAFTAPSASSQGCTTAGPAADEAAVALDVGDTFVAVRGAIGGRIARVRLIFGDGTVQEAPIFSGPGGHRFVVAVLPAAPVPDAWQAVGFDGSMVAIGSLH
jgi:hypothetical protein